MQKGKTPEEQRRLELAAKYLVRASAGVPKKDKQHSPLSQDEIEGSKYIEEQKMLSSLAKERNKSLQWAQTMEVAKMAEGLSGDPDKYTQRTFDYTAGDYTGDLISSKGEEAVFRFEHGEEAFVGTIGSLTLKGASKIISTMPFGLGDETASTLDGASYHLLEHAVTHGFGLIEPEYRPTEGSIVQASFKGPVKDSYTSEHASSLLSIGTIGLGSTIKGATKLGKIVPKAFKSTAVTKEPTISSLTTGLDSSHLYESGTSSRIGISEIDRAIKKAERKEVVGVTKDKTPKVTEGLKIVRNNKGRVKGVEHTQNHHILHQKLHDHDLWTKAGMDVEDSLNKMLLPTKKGASLSTTNRSIHEGRHFKNIEKEFRENMDDIVNKGKVENYTKEQYREALKELINNERELLYEGNRALNKNARPWATK